MPIYNMGGSRPFSLAVDQMQSPSVATNPLQFLGAQVSPPSLQTQPHSVLCPPPYFPQPPIDPPKTEAPKSMIPSSMEIQHGGDHYKGLGIQPVEYALANDLDCLQFSAIKYITRHKTKGEGAKDLKKAIHFLQMALEKQYGTKSSVQYEGQSE